eukprot:scaffold3236_cov66-Cylindrotheca_fusiformis.AAC.10
MAASGNEHTEQQSSPNVFRFDRDTSLVPMDVTHVFIDSSVEEIVNADFLHRQQLVEAEFSEGLEVIGPHAFGHCSALKRLVNLPSSLQSIMHYAFHFCESMDSIEFPNSLYEIGACAFMECSLRRVHIYSSSITPPSKGVHITSFSKLRIEELAFASCSNLISVNLSGRIESIGIGCFSNCSSLESVKIISNDLESVGDGAFRSCFGLKSIDLSGGPKFQTILSCTFSNCSSLTHVRIPSTIETIEYSAFERCTRLLSLEVPEGLEVLKIGGNLVGSFPGCTSLVNLVVPIQQQLPVPTQQELPWGVVDEEEGIGELKLRVLGSTYGELILKLQHRFDSLPLHRQCYYQSYYSLADSMEVLEDTSVSHLTQTDALGMTPFHILCLSQTPSIHLLEALFRLCDRGVKNHLLAADKFCSNPIDYLCRNHTQASATAIQLVIHEVCSRDVQSLGLARWRSDLTERADKALEAEWSLKRSKLQRFFMLLAIHEQMEISSLLELALWKKRLGEESTFRKEEMVWKGDACCLDEHDLQGSEAVDRQACRISCGAFVIVPNVLPFLGNPSVF